jgi:neutral trehalase
MMPVKANSLMYEAVVLLARDYFQEAEETGDPLLRESLLQKAKLYEQKAQDLADIIWKYCRTDDNFMADYDFVNNKTLPGKSLSGVYALGAGIVPWTEGRRMLDVLDERFSKPGGMPNTLYKGTDQQWDYEAWAIGQLEAIDAAIMYDRPDLALKWTSIWLSSNDKMLVDLYALMEKTSVDNPGKPGGGGEYKCVRNLLMSICVDMELRQRTLPWLEKRVEESYASQFDRMFTVSDAA